MTTSSTLSLTLRSAGSSAQSAPKIAARDDHQRHQAEGGQELALADEAGGDGAGHQLALGADVPELCAEGDERRRGR